MNLYPSGVTPFSDLMGNAFRHYAKVLKVVFPFILLLSFFKVGYPYLDALFKNHAWHIVTMTLLGLLEIYCCALALYAANAVLKGKPEALKEICNTINAKLSLIYSGVFALALGLCLLFFVGYLLSHLVIFFFAGKTVVQGMAYLFLIGLPMTFALVLFVFSVPLLILDNTTVWPAFRSSAFLIGCRHWLHAFVVYAAVLIMLLILSPMTKHGHWLLAHHLSFLVDVAALLFFVPLIINFMLLLINDLRIRRR